MRRIPTVSAALLVAAGMAGCRERKGPKPPKAVPHPVEAREAERPGTLVVDDDDQVRVRTHPPQPPYPAEARRLGIEGTVQLKLAVGPKGRVTRIEAISGPAELRATAVAYGRDVLFEVDRHAIPPGGNEASFTMQVRFQLVHPRTPPGSSSTR